MQVCVRSREVELELRAIGKVVPVVYSSLEEGEEWMPRLEWDDWGPVLVVRSPTHGGHFLPVWSGMGEDPEIWENARLDHKVYGDPGEPEKLPAQIVFQGARHHRGQRVLTRKARKDWAKHFTQKGTRKLVAFGEQVKCGKDAMRQERSEAEAWLDQHGMREMTFTPREESEMLRDNQGFAVPVRSGTRVVLGSAPYGPREVDAPSTIMLHEAAVLAYGD